MKNEIESSYSCDSCGKKIIGKKAYNILQHKKSGQTKTAYCSKECRKESKWKYKEIIKCKNCNKKIEIYKRFIKKNNFCSHSCGAIFNNKDKIIPKRYCIKCSKILNGKSEYCRSCGINKYRDEYIKRWKEGKETGHDSFYSITSIIRCYILNKYNNKCSECGWNKTNPKTNKIPLHIDHIDGNYKNSSEENLRAICPNCHSLTITYGPLNNGRGREHKRNYNRKYKIKISKS